MNCHPRIDCGLGMLYTAEARRATVSSSILLADEAGLARRDVRHNAVALGADFALFLVGLSFASQSTILPAFAAHLGAPNVVIGAIPAVMTLGWVLPSLFAAGHTESLARKLPFVMRYTLWERVPFLVLALVAFFVATPGARRRARRAARGAPRRDRHRRHPDAGVDGHRGPGDSDDAPRPLLRRCERAGQRGGPASAAWARRTCSRGCRRPASYGVCFLCAALCMGLSYVALALVREPAAAATAPRQPMGALSAPHPRPARRATAT